MSSAGLAFVGTHLQLTVPAPVVWTACMANPEQSGLESLSREEVIKYSYSIGAQGGFLGHH